MDELSYWKQRVVQALHDPPAKPYCFFPKATGHFLEQHGRERRKHRRAHEDAAALLFEQLTSQRLDYACKNPDLAATGADRPVVSPPRSEGISPLSTLAFWKEQASYITHPLIGDQLVYLPRPTNQEGVVQREQAVDLLEEQSEAVRDLKLIEWSDPTALKHGALQLWRLLREALTMVHHPDLEPEEAVRRGSPLWERMPADTRVPDHSVWEHTKITSALSFLKSRKGEQAEAHVPYLVTWSIDPVQAFIREARTTRDLWVSSLLLADLAWHGMLPIVEHYGPEAIVYPDLRANPIVDRWLSSAAPGALPVGCDDPATFAAVLPNTFTAILPRGGEGHLRDLGKLMQQCGEGFEKRWELHCRTVREWLEDSLSLTGSESGWAELWQRQSRTVLSCHWTAVAWKRPESIDPAAFAMLSRGRALPAQERGAVPKLREEDHAKLERRKAQLEPWMPPRLWGAYEDARAVYGRTNAGLLQGERGFDYALVHHQLKARHGLQKQRLRALRAGSGDPEAGEKCTLCGTRAALCARGTQPEGTGAARHDAEKPAEMERQEVRAFWRTVEGKVLGRNRAGSAEAGRERLCAVCATKRFLVPASRTSGFNELWQLSSEAVDRDAQVRVPFPSTSMLALQEHMAAVFRDPDPKLRELLSNVRKAHRRTGLERTAFAGSLPQLAALEAEGDELVRELLRIEPQQIFWPESLELLKRQTPDGDSAKEALEELKRACAALLDKIGRRQATSPNGTRSDAGDQGDTQSAGSIPRADPRFAVIQLDGDRMGRLIAGDPEVVRARWRDVLHPHTVEQLRKNPTTVAAGWEALLDVPRLSGPALHAFISRALSDFAHKIVPWVVEQEFAGRLIYAGGDDVLVLAPAADALALAARLQQLYSAAWVIDTDPQRDAWWWRRAASDPGMRKPRFAPERARQRFVIPVPDDEGRIRWPVLLSQVERPIRAGKNWRHGYPPQLEGRLMAMLGGYQSLSASIVYGHFKTELGRMLATGRELLERFAKRRMGGGHVALGHYSRQGLKTRFAMPWRVSSEQSYEVFQRLVTAFASDSAPNASRSAAPDWGDALSGELPLPRRLPYKLRELPWATLSSLRDDAPSELDGLLLGWIEQSLDGVKPPREVQNALLWALKQGDVCTRPREGDSDPSAAVAGAADGAASNGWVDGLVLARYLGSQGEEDDD